MNTILFGDAFINIKHFLLPVNLYILSLSCKKYSRMINKNDIRKSTISQINWRLHIIFGDDYFEFAQILHDADAIITGSFIMQCMLGEVWKGSSIHIVIKSTIIKNFSIVDILNGEERWDEMCKFMSVYNVDYKSTYDPVKNISSKKYRVNKNLIKIVCDYRSDNVYKKGTYNVTSGDLFVNNTYDIFTKRVNLYLKSGDMIDPKSFFKMYRRGFKFYKFDNDRTALSNDDIYCLMCSTIKIKGRRKRKECESYIDRNKFTIKDGTINGWMRVDRERFKPYPLFDINKKSQHYANIKTLATDYTPIGIEVRIYKCTDYKTQCITKLLCSKLEHYHCICARKEFILIPSY